MTARLKSQVFIDTLVFDLSETLSPSLNAVLRDDQGKVCNSLNTKFEQGIKTFCWSGFNELPYGVYTLELSGEEEKRLLNLVKRI
ncbi:MAG: hypothetical protein KF746_01590 [Chitinophagaceae bacterium]|nr:hypothetical protein [Chitinophagaceae bacterium]